MYITVAEFLALPNGTRAELTELRLRSRNIERLCNLSEGRMKAFVTALQACVQLRALELPLDTQMVLINEFRILFTAIAKCSQLRSLSLPIDLSRINAEQLTLIINAIRTLKSLESLNLSGANLGALNDSKLALVINAIRALPQLKCLQIDDNNLHRLNHQQLALLMNAIQSRRQLQTLSLGNNHFAQFNTADFTFLLNMLQACSQLQSLHLDQNGIGTFDISRLSILTNALRSLTQLTNLSLSKNSLYQLDVPHASLLSNLLRALSGLKSLNLSDNVIGIIEPEIFAILTDALKNCALSALDLSSNGIGLLDKREFHSLISLIAALRIKKLDLRLNMLNELHASRFTLLGNTLRNSSELQSIDLRSNDLDEIDPLQLQEFIDLIINNQTIFSISHDDLSSTQQATLKQHYLNLIQKNAYTQAKLALFPNTENQAQRNNDKLETPDYEVSIEEIANARQAGIDLFRTEQYASHASNTLSVPATEALNPTLAHLPRAFALKHRLNTYLSLACSATTTLFTTYLFWPFVPAMAMIPFVAWGTFSFISSKIRMRDQRLQNALSAPVMPAANEVAAREQAQAAEFGRSCATGWVPYFTNSFQALREGRYSRQPRSWDRAYAEELTRQYVPASRLRLD